MKRKSVISGTTLDHVQFSAGGRTRPQESIVSSLLLLVLSPLHLRGAKVVGGTEAMPPRYLVDRQGPNGEAYHVGPEDVAEVPPCCYAAPDAEYAEKMYAAYNLGGPIERAGLTWDDKQVPTWAKLVALAEEGNAGARGVLAKWRAEAEFVLFAMPAKNVVRLIIHGEGLAPKPLGSVTWHPIYGAGIVVTVADWAWIEEYPIVDPGLPAPPSAVEVPAQ